MTLDEILWCFCDVILSLLKSSSNDRKERKSWLRWTRVHCKRLTVLWLFYVLYTTGQKFLKHLNQKFLIIYII